MFTTFWITVSLCVPRCFSQNLLLATDSGVKTLFVPTGSVTSLHSQAATAVDFRYNSRDVYFISNSSNQIFYSYYSLYYQALSTPVPRVMSSSPLSSLAVDWVSFKLYYGNPSEGSLIKETLRASTPEELASQLFELKNFALDPYERLLFFTTHGYLFSLALNDTIVNRHYLKGSGLKEVVALALDLHAKEVYMVCQRETDSDWVLVVKGYPNSAETEYVYGGGQLQGVRALAVYDGLIFWASPCGDEQCLYSCRRSSCYRDNVTISWKTFEVINDVKFYSALVQTPDTSSACLLCSHGCIQAAAECACPDSMEVGENGVECIRKPPSWGQKLTGLMDDLVDKCRQWYTSLVAALTPYWYPCGGLLLALLLCCLCLVTTIPCSKVVEEEEEEEFPLRERHHPNCPRRQTRRHLSSIEE